MIGECWEVDRWSKEPKAILILRETACQIVVESVGWRGEKREQKCMKRGRNIFATWTEAKAWMVDAAANSLKYAKQEVDRRRSELERIKALKEPKDQLDEAGVSK
jgi:hypothetical protein